MLITRQQKMRGPIKGNTNQQKNYELKQRVVIALNKLADRDTYQVGVDELNKIVECMTPEGIIPFLSCILDTDSEQKSAVRKECVRLMGSLASFWGIGSHLGKMVASIVKRLKDQDSVVRDACVETMGVLALKLGNDCKGENSDGVFVVLVKPLFEALGEQNRYVQSGSALCLARVIDNTCDPPISILQRMLSRTTHLLKNSHFMAKPAVIELNRSIIQAGGAPSENVLSAAMTSIQEALKNSDWTTRKAASVALGSIAAGGDTFLGPFKASTIRSLESCRFDKVKPVRDTVVQALNLWKSIQGSDSSEPSEAGSSIKENFCCDYSDSTKASDSGRRDKALKRNGRTSVKQRLPLSDRKACQNYLHSPPDRKADDWQVEVVVPKTRNASLEDIHMEESECSSFSKTVEGMSADITSTLDTGYDYVPMDDKQECFSVSNHVAHNFETKFVQIDHDCLGENGLVKPLGENQRFVAEEVTSRGQICSKKIRDRRSIDSTVTESSSQTPRDCCLQTANEMVSIRKQLLEIENSQSNLMNILKVFTSNTMDSLSLIQSKVSSLEQVVDRIARDIVHGGGYSDSGSSKFLKKSNGFTSPRISLCTPRPSIDMHNKLPSRISTETAGTWEEKTFARTRLSNSSKPDSDIWNDPKGKITRNHLKEKSIQKSSGQGPLNLDCGQRRKIDASFASAPTDHVKQNGPESKDSLWKRVKGFLFEGDLDSAYEEALCSGDELVLAELLDRTGPVLDSMSQKTASELLTTLASYFLERRYLKSIIPWLLQVVDLSTVHGSNYLVLSAKVRREFLLALQEVVNGEFSNPVERRSIKQLAIKLHQIWGVSS